MVALLALTGSAKAQTFEFQYQGQSLKDGDMVTIAAEANAFGELSCETNPSANPENGLMLKLLSGTTADVKARLEITHNTLSPQMLQWCMGGKCEPFMNTDVLKKTFTVNAKEQVLFDATNIQSKGYLLATLEASVGTEKQTVTIQFTNGEATGINGTKQTKESQKVYDLNGRLLPVNAVGTGALPSGIYLVGGKKVVFK